MNGIKILLVDDNKEKETFFEPIADLVSNLIGSDLHQACTFDEMKAIFDESPYQYQAVILDGKGQKNNNSKTEDDSFLSTSLKWFEQKNREGIYIPYVIYSGYAEELKKYYDDEPIYWKGKSQETEMLQILKEKVEQGEYYKNRKLCPDIFELLDYSLLDTNYQPDLIKAAQVYSDIYVGNRIEVLRSLRPMLEATFLKLHKLDADLISPKFFRKGDPNISGIIHYLAGSPKFNREKDELEFFSDTVIPAHVYYLTDTLKNITSKAAMHHYDENSSKYLVKAAVNAFFDYCLWYKKFAKENYLN